LTTAQEGGKSVSLTHLLHLPQEILLELISVKAESIPGPYVNEIFQ